MLDLERSCGLVFTATITRKITIIKGQVRAFATIREVLRSLDMLDDVAYFLEGCFRFCYSHPNSLQESSRKMFFFSNLVLALSNFYFCLYLQNLSARHFFCLYRPDRVFKEDNILNLLHFLILLSGKFSWSVSQGCLFQSTMRICLPCLIFTVDPNPSCSKYYLSKFLSLCSSFS